MHSLNTICIAVNFLRVESYRQVFLRATQLVGFLPLTVFTDIECAKLFLASRRTEEVFSPICVMMMVCTMINALVQVSPPSPPSIGTSMAEQRNF